MKEHGFNRYDIVVRLLAIEDYYKKNNFGFKLYEKMQMQRIAEKPFLNDGHIIDYNKQFRILIQSFENNGYMKEQYPLILNENSHLINGSHRLSLVYFHKYNYVSCLYSCKAFEYHDNINYGVSWFENKFDIDECEIIKHRLKNMLIERGGLAYAVVWPMSRSEVDFVEKEMNKYYKIINYIEIKFKYINELAAFIELIYSKDVYRSERVNDKLSNLSLVKDGMCIRMYQVKYSYDEVFVETELLESKDIRHHMIQNLIHIKNKIRFAIKINMNRYVFDNAFHCGDTMAENQFLQQIYEKYRLEKTLI